MTNCCIVWSKMQAEAGEPLTAIIARKEAERIAGDGHFFWGIGTSLGDAVIDMARSNGGTLPVLWSVMKSMPKAIDAEPSAVLRWTSYVDWAGRECALPDHVMVTSRLTGRDHHYALVCRSDAPLALGDLGPFDPAACTTMRGKAPGPSQVTALLRDSGNHHAGTYRVAFRAELTEPWAVRLVRPVVRSIDA
jgi:hypothetical protein